MTPTTTTSGRAGASPRRDVEHQGDVVMTTSASEAAPETARIRPERRRSTRASGAPSKLLFEVRVSGEPGTQAIAHCAKRLREFARRGAPRGGRRG